MTTRFLKRSLEKQLNSGKVIILVGARQVGKTTLAKELLKHYEQDQILSYNGDNLEAQKLSKMESGQIRALVDRKKCLFIDEAHKIVRIGDIVKSLVDEFGDRLQIILTGSSTINLIDNTNEPLTGRKRVFELFPISLGELGLSPDKAIEVLPTVLRFGLYPEVVNAEFSADKQEALRELAESSVYRDVLDVTGARASGDLVALLRYLARNIGQTLSLNEAGIKLSIDRRAIDRYVELLTKSYIVFPLYPYSRTGSISRAYKVYFWDVGIRNALAEDLSELASRSDRHAVWQNFCIAERLKRIKYGRQLLHHYFWRSYDGAEMDLVETKGDKIRGYKLVYEQKGLRKSEVFKSMRPEAEETISLDNFIQSDFYKSLQI